MAKQSESDKKLQEELQKRLAVRENLKDADRIKRELQKAGDIDGFSGGGDYEIESLSTIGKSDNQLVENLKENLEEYLQKVGDYAFDNSQLPRYFPGNKMLALVKAMKSAGLEMESRYIMDIFKTRVKNRSGGKMPTIKERKGLLGGSTERNMKPEEIVHKFDVEVDMPKTGDDVAPLTAVGTQKGILKHLNETLLQNEDILDPFKKAPRKAAAKFLQAVKILNPSTADPSEKMFVAGLLTPDSIQPKSSGDKEQIEKLSAILKKGTKYIDQKLEAANKAKGGEDSQSAKNA